MVLMGARKHSYHKNKNAAQEGYNEYWTLDVDKERHNFPKR